MKRALRDIDGFEYPYGKRPKHGEETDDDLHPLTRQPEDRAPRIGIAALLHEEGIGVRPAEGRKRAT